MVIQTQSLNSTNDNQAPPVQDGHSSLPNATKSKRRSLLQRIGRNASARIGIFLLGILTLASLFAPLITSVSPNDMNTSSILMGPSSEHWFGTDDFGRDLLSRVLYGGRISIIVGFSVAIITTVLGLVLGSLAGYYSHLDNLIMRIMDILMAIPAILLAIAIMAILGPEAINVIAALSIAFLPRSTRIVRAEILQIKERDYIQASQAVGLPDSQILIRHAIPNGITPLLIQQTFILALAILAESTLSFLGVGVPPSVPTLGSILSDSRQFLQVAPWMSLFPGVFISLLVLGFNVLGDGLRDVLDPHSASQ